MAPHHHPVPLSSVYFAVDALSQICRMLSLDKAATPYSVVPGRVLHAALNSAAEARISPTPPTRRFTPPNPLQGSPAPSKEPDRPPRIATISIYILAIYHQLAS